MTTVVTPVTGGFKEKWDEFEKNKEKVEKKIKDTVSESINKAKEESVKVIDIIGKKISGEKKDRTVAKRPLFMAGMLLNEKSGSFFKMSLSDIYGSQGKIAMWIRHALLTHIRNSGVEDKFLGSLAAANSEGVEAVWKDVLCKLGVPDDEQPGKIKKLMSETSWVALTLLKEKVKQKALKMIDAARETAWKIKNDDLFAESYTNMLFFLQKDKMQRLMLEKVGLSKSKAKELAGLIAEKGKDAAPKIIEELRAHLPGIIKRLDKIRKDIDAMPLSKYNAFLDFKPQLKKIMKDLGSGKVKNDFLSAEAAKAKVDAAAGRLAKEISKAYIEVASFVAFAVATKSVVTASTPVLLKYLWWGGSAILEGAELAPTAFGIYDDCMDRAMLIRLGIPAGGI